MRFLLLSLPFHSRSFWRSGKIQQNLFENFVCKRFLVFGKQTYTSEAAAIVSKTFRSISHQENTWTTRNKDITQIYTGWTFTCANFTYNNLALRQINIRLNTHTSHTKKKNKKKSKVLRADGRLVNMSGAFVQTMHKLPPSFPT